MWKGDKKAVDSALVGAGIITGDEETKHMGRSTKLAEVGRQDEQTQDHLLRESSPLFSSTHTSMVLSSGSHTKNSQPCPPQTNRLIRLLPLLSQDNAPPLGGDP